MIAFDDSFTTNLPSSGLFYFPWGKPAPVVIVESPEAEREVRERYPEETYRIIRQYPNP